MTTPSPSERAHGGEEITPEQEAAMRQIAVDDPTAKVTLNATLLLDLIDRARRPADEDGLVHREDCEVCLSEPHSEAAAGPADEDGLRAEGWGRAHHDLCTVVDYSDAPCHINPYRAALARHPAPSAPPYPQPGTVGWDKHPPAYAAPAPATVVEESTLRGATDDELLAEMNSRISMRVEFADSEGGGPARLTVVEEARDD